MLEQAELFTLCRYVLRHFNIRVTSSALRKDLKYHPYVPSIIGLMDVFGNWGIHAEAVEGSFSQLQEVELPCIVIMNDHYAVLTGINKNEVQYHAFPGGRCSQGSEQFCKHWDGIALLLKRLDYHGQDNYPAERKKETWQSLRIPLQVTAIVLLLAFVVFNASIALLSAGGIAWTWQLVKMEMDGAATGLAAEVCGINKNGCEQVTASAAAKLFGVVSLVDLAMVFFASILLSAVLNGSAIYTALACAVLCLPYSIFLLYYQWKVVRAWCFLCLPIHAIIWAQAACIVFLSPRISVDLIMKGLPVFCGITIIIAAAWSAVRPLLEARRRAGRLALSMAYLKRRPGVFLSILKENSVEDTGVFSADVVYGDAGAPVKITLVVSPGCIYCSQVSCYAMTLMERFPGKVCIVIRSVTANCTEAAAWIKACGIHHVPSIFVNNCQWPAEYDFFHVHQFMDELIQDSPSYSPGSSICPSPTSYPSQSSSN